MACAALAPVNGERVEYVFYLHATLYFVYVYSMVSVNQFSRGPRPPLGSAQLCLCALAAARPGRAPRTGGLSLTKIIAAELVKNYISNKSRQQQNNTHRLHAVRLRALISVSCTCRAAPALQPTRSRDDRMVAQRADALFAHLLVYEPVVNALCVEVVLALQRPHFGLGLEALHAQAALLVVVGAQAASLGPCPRGERPDARYDRCLPSGARGSSEGKG